MSSLEAIAAFLGILYVLLAIRNIPVCFIFGLIGSLIWAYISFTVYNLKWDALLNIFYAVMSIYGFWVWTGGKDTVEVPISKVARSEHTKTVIIGILSTIGMTFFGKYFINSSYALLDALTTVLSIIGTIYIAKRYLSSWIYLLVADLIYIYVYYSSGASIFMWMMVFYSFMAILGLIQWQKLHSNEKYTSVYPSNRS